MRHRHDRRPTDYVLPFLILIGIGVIFVLIFQLGSYVIGGKTRQLEDKGQLYLAAGRAELKQWGDGEWSRAYDGTVILEGDSVKTAPNSKAVIRFFNDSVIRLDSSTEIFIDTLESRGSEDHISILLSSGAAWVVRAPDKTVESLFSVRTKNLIVRTIGTVFDVAYAARGEEVHVIEGKVRVDVLSEEGGDRTVDSLDVGVGQQILFGTGQLEQFRARRAPDILAALSDEFETSPWYRWNRMEDESSVATADVRSGSDFAIVADGTESADSAAETDKPNEPDLANDTKDSDVKIQISAPVVEKPLEGERTISDGDVLIEGTVNSGAASLRITSSADSSGEPYVLKTYKAGDTTWSYRASTALGNLKPGKNVFSIVAADADGKESSAATVTITFEAAVSEPPAELLMPTVDTFNGKKELRLVGGNVVAIVGSVGTWAQSVVVNDYALSKYVPGSGEWTYFANYEFGNLKEGDNPFTVYATDLQGRKSPVLEFTLTWYLKEPVAENPESTVESSKPAWLP